MRHETLPLTHGVASASLVFCAGSLHIQNQMLKAETPQGSAIKKDREFLPGLSDFTNSDRAYRLRINQAVEAIRVRTGELEGRGGRRVRPGSGVAKRAGALQAVSAHPANRDLVVIV